MNSVILRAGARYLAGLLLLFSIYMLLRGHNEPGGGFIGGLIGATGFVLYAIACGTADARAALRLTPEAIAVAGLGLALLAGLSAALFGDAFFTGQWLFIGETEDDKGLPLSTVLVFDLGVYLAVFGSILALVFTMEEEV
ncbi:MAG: Na+/H+ antiporter subunit B [Pseudomonadota bacterium]